MIEILELLRDLSKNITYIKAWLNNLDLKQHNVLSKEWIDNQDVLIRLKISNRTLQNYRDKGILPFSKIEGKFYYKTSDVNQLLERNYSNRQNLEK